MPKRYERNCDQCGKPYRGPGQYFCSRSCRMTWRNLRDSPSKQPGARAKISASRIGKPTTTGRVLPRNQRDKIAASLTGKKQSADTIAKKRAWLIDNGHKPPRGYELRGPDHPNWKGGTSPIRAVVGRSPAYRAFRDAVMQRDNWTCQDCGKRGGKLHAHHIIPWAEHPDGQYDPENGVALCVPCHRARHRGQPRPKAVGPRTLAELRSDRDEA
jgi:hypothetical protein